MKVLDRALLIGLACAACLFAPVAFAQAGETVKIAVIDPLSGGAAVTGRNQLKTAEFFAGIMNRSRGLSEPRFEVIGLDSKLDPEEAVARLHEAIAQGARYITQGNGSAVALALSQAVSQHNARHPGREVVYVNQAAIDPVLTNEQCSFWHFRIDADVSMRVQAIAAFVNDEPSIRKVYLLNQDYSFGRQVSKLAREAIRAKRPEVEIVGDEFVPLSATSDFSAHVARVQAAGADTVITGNWGKDLSLLAEAAVAQGYGGRFITFYADRAGAPQAFGAAGVGRVYVVAATHVNMGGMASLLSLRFRQQYGEDLQSFHVVYSLMLIGEGIRRAGSTDPVKVAAAMEGLRLQGFSGEMTMRAQDHQMQQPMFLLVMGRTGEKYFFGLENTGYTLIPEKRYDAQVASTPSTCRMLRPAGAASGAARGLRTGAAS